MKNQPNIAFEKGAETSFELLSEKDRTKGMAYLASFAVDQDKFPREFYYPLKDSQDTYSIVLNEKLRIIVQRKANSLLVLDLLNHDLYLRFFKNRA